MRRSFVLVLTALMLICSLTACGNRNNGTVQDPPTTENSTSDTTQSDNSGSGSAANGSNSAINGSGGAAGGSSSTESGQNSTAGDAVDDVVDGVQDAVDDVLPGDNANTRQRSTGGVSYGDMMNKNR